MSLGLPWTACVMDQASRKHQNRLPIPSAVTMSQCRLNLVQTIERRLLEILKCSRRSRYRSPDISKSVHSFKETLSFLWEPHQPCELARFDTSAWALLHDLLRKTSALSEFSGRKRLRTHRCYMYITRGIVLLLDTKRTPVRASDIVR